MMISRRKFLRGLAIGLPAAAAAAAVAPLLPEITSGLKLYPHQQRAVDMLLTDEAARNLMKRQMLAFHYGYGPDRFIGVSDLMRGSL